MEHFDIVLQLARLAIDSEGQRATQQIERLRDHLEISDKDQAAKLNRLLSRDGRRHTMAPLSMEEMRSTATAARKQLSGEFLSPATPAPCDRETGTPLARIVFPGDIENPPILNQDLETAIHDLLAEWNHGDELARLGARPHMRCLIYGPPGVGKTKLARFLAHQVGLPCVEARLDGLVSSFLGTTSRNIGSLFEFANRYRCVLFLDEFDAVAKARDDGQEIGEIKRVVNTLLQSLDVRNGKGITLAATNHEQLLDIAIWRRFDSQIELQKPDKRTRELLLKHFLNPLRIRAEELKFLVWATEDMSGADIEILIEAGKRFLVLSRTPERNNISVTARGESPRKLSRGPLILNALRRQALLNARLFAPDRKSVLLDSDKTLDEVLKEAGFKQADRGAILGLSQSAVSRRSKKGEDVGEQRKEVETLNA